MKILTREEFTADVGATYSAMECCLFPISVDLGSALDVFRDVIARMYMYMYMLRNPRPTQMCCAHVVLKYFQ